MSNSVSPKLRSDATALSRWLFVVAFMVLAIVVVGGITRLTESGVSITEWKPVSGTLPCSRSPRPCQPRQQRPAFPGAPEGRTQELRPGALRRGRYRLSD